ncbi:MAG: arylsulfatase [Saprospiraceae bacterium]
MTRKINPLYLIFSLFCLLSLMSACGNPAHEANSKKEHSTLPNIIYILADDLGYGDLGCYGQQNFQTPNIDRLAAEGIRFTQHYAGSTVCAPSRSCLLTGLHTGHTPVRDNHEIQPEGQWPIPAETYMLPEMLKEMGYTTGVFGKWGLGYPGSEGDPNNQGVDQFFGYNCQRLAHHYYPYYLWNNQEKYMLPGNEGQQKGTYAPNTIHEKALSFIENNKDKPFFLFYASPIPHAELFALESYMEKYRGKYPPEKAYDGVDEGEKYRTGPYGTQSESHAAFVAMIDLLDQQVGEVVAKVKALGLAENTLIIFTSDNGPHLEGGADPDYFDSNGPLKGYKRDLYEGGIRVPLIASWPGKIKAGSSSDHISAFWDFMPTLADLTGQTIKGDIDGISYLPSLLGEHTQKEHDYLYWEFHSQGGRVALRQGDWKLVRYNVGKGEPRPFELYDLSKDIGETHDLAAEFPEKVAAMASLLSNARTDSEVFQFGGVGYNAER